MRLSCNVDPRTEDQAERPGRGPRVRSHVSNTTRILRFTSVSRPVEEVGSVWCGERNCNQGKSQICGRGVELYFFLSEVRGFQFWIAIRSLETMAP